jgi:uncharacterized protein with NRDE domain
LIVWDWDPVAKNLLVLSNRDEAYHRPALPLHAWPDSKIFAGRDQEALGTWLGCSRNGRLAAVTNFRSGKTPNPQSKSRGELVTQFLTSEMSAEDFLQKTARHADAYNAFNLLVFDGQTLIGLESHSGQTVTMSAGISGVSNAGFDTPWPKLTATKTKFEKLRQLDRVSEEDYFAILGNTQLADLSSCPSTGVPQHIEHQLSAVFIKMPGYGTRASSVVQMGSGAISFQERTFDEQGPQGQTTLQFPVSA